MPRLHSSCFTTTPVYGPRDAVQRHRHTLLANALWVSQKQIPIPDPINQSIRTFFVTYKQPPESKLNFLEILFVYRRVCRRIGLNGFFRYPFRLFTTICTVSSAHQWTQSSSLTSFACYTCCGEKKTHTQFCDVTKGTINCLRLLHWSLGYRIKIWKWGPLGNIIIINSPVTLSRLCLLPIL